MYDTIPRIKKSLNTGVKWTLETSTATTFPEPASLTIQHETPSSNKGRGSTSVRRTCYSNVNNFLSNPAMCLINHTHIRIEQVGHLVSGSRCLQNWNGRDVAFW